MKRLALALAAAALGTGCYAPAPCSPSAVIDWSYHVGSGQGGFLAADNTVLPDCATAGVTTVEVFANGAKMGSFPCTSAPRSVALFSGPNDVIVEGLDGVGTILYRHRFPIDTASCGSQGTFVAQPGEGRVNLSYSFSPVNACYSPGPSFIWVRVWDDIAGVVAADSASAPEVNDTCGIDNPISFRLAEGSFTLLSTEEVVRSGGSYAVVGANCTHAALPVAAGAVTSISPVLVDATAFCP